MSILDERLSADVGGYGRESNSDLMSVLGEQVEAERDNKNDHIRGQDWKGEDERELIVSHGEIMPTVMMSINQWTPPFVVLVGVLAVFTVFAVVMRWRSVNIQQKWVKDDYVPISDGSGNTSHMMYV